MPAPVAAPAPRPAAPKKQDDTLAAFDALIEGADDEEDIPAPAAAPKTEPAAPAPKAEEPVQEDTFYKDPLIQTALVKFEAEFIKN
jgi:hypothetical protein